MPTTLISVTSFLIVQSKYQNINSSAILLLLPTTSLTVSYCDFDPSRVILLTLFVSRNLTAIHLPLSGSLNSLLCDLIAPTPGLAFTPQTTSSLAAAWSFSSGRAYYSRNFRFSLFFSLDPYSDYVEMNISLNDLSSLSFLNVYTPPIRSSTDSTTDFFSPSILSSGNVFILGNFNFHHSL